MKSLGWSLFFITALAAGLLSARADYREETCRTALSRLKKYRKTYTEKIAREKNQIYCALAVRDAQRATPDIPAECAAVEVAQVSPGFQSELKEMIADATRVSPQAAIGSLLTELIQEIDLGFDAQCAKLPPT